MKMEPKPSDQPSPMDQIPNFSLAGLCSLSSIANALPLPSAIENPDDTLLDGEEAKEAEILMQNPDKNLVRNIISALGNVKTSFDLADSTLDSRSEDNLPNNPLITEILGEKSDVFERHEDYRNEGCIPQSSAKEIRDEKLAKKEKKRLKKERKEKEREEGKPKKGEKKKKKEKRKKRASKDTHDLSHDESTRDSTTSEMSKTDCDENGDKMEIDTLIEESTVSTNEVIQPIEVSNEVKQSTDVSTDINIPQDVPVDINNSFNISTDVNLPDVENVAVVTQIVRTIPSENQRKTITGQIYGSIMENLTQSDNQGENQSEKKEPESMDVDERPVTIPKNIDFCRVRFVESGVKREIYNIKEMTRRDGSYLLAFHKVRIGEILIAKQTHDGKLAEAVVLDPTVVRTKSLEEEHSKKTKKYVGYVEGVDKKYHCYVKVKNLSKAEINTIVKKYAKIERKRKEEQVKEDQQKKKKVLIRLFHEKISDEEIHACTKRFKDLVDTALAAFSSADVTVEAEDSALYLEEHQLKNIAKEAAKLRAINAIGDIKKKRLSRMCQLMEVNMRRGCRIALFPVKGSKGEKEREDEKNMSRQERIAAINCALEAGLSVMYVLTAKDLSGSLLSDNVIERVIELCRFQLQNTIYPEFDPVYRTNGVKVKSDRQKRAQNKITNHSSSVMRLFTRVADLLALIGELSGKVMLLDQYVIKIATIAISPFFVENIQQIQLSAIRCATVIFSKYPDHRRSLLDDILNSLARLPTTKRNLRNYRLSHLMDEDDDEVMCIQMLSALVLQLVQSVAKVPSPVQSDQRQFVIDGKTDTENVDELSILSSLDMSYQISKMFLTIFLDKISSKKEEIDYRPLFENFIQDLLSTVNKPEWPAAENMLTILGKLLVRNFLNRKVEISLRTASLEYLGVVAARLRKDAITSQIDVAEVRPLVAIVDHGVERKDAESDRDLLRRQLQSIVIQHLNAGKKVDSAMEFSLNYIIAQWIKDLNEEQSTKKYDDLEMVDRLRTKRDHVHNLIQYPPDKELELSYDDISIISRYLSAGRSFNQSFDVYLRQILSVSNEPAVQIRTKALKCLTEIVSVDPSILSQDVIAKSIHNRMQDMATSVREAAVDLIGRFILTRPEVANQYYKMLTERILDTGVSVRKRVIKILRDLCLEVKDFPYIGNACVRIIKRVNDDEEGIKKLVLEVFSKLWFSPIEETNDPSDFKNLIEAKSRIVTDVVSTCPDVEWLQDLLKGLIKGQNNDVSRDAASSCEQLAKCVSDSVLANSSNNKNRMVACFTTLLLIAKVRSEIITPYVKILHPYLNVKIRCSRDLQIVIKTEKILELCVPLMSHPPADWLRLLEMDLMKIIMFSHNEAVEGAIACLGALVNKVSKKYDLVWECFIRYYSFLKKIVDQDNVEEVMHNTKKVIFLRSIQTIGYLHKTFDFDQKEIAEAKKVNFNIKEETYEKLLSLVPIEMLGTVSKSIVVIQLQYTETDLQTNVLSALGHLMVQEPTFMLMEMTKALYDGVLTSDNEKLRFVVLQNFDNYLKEEDNRLSNLEAEENAKKKEEKKEIVKENLKEMQDVRSSQASAVIQQFLKQIQDAYVSSDPNVRKACLSVIIKVQNQGLVAPLGLLHTLIAASADPTVPNLRTSADHVMHEINKRQNVIHVAALRGLRKAFKVARIVAGAIINDDDDETTPIYDEIPRGYLQGEYGKTASCCHLYALLREKKYRRAFVTQLLSTFDDFNEHLDHILYIGMID